jgi:FkbM family methyltransferase
MKSLLRPHIEQILRRLPVSRVAFAERDALAAQLRASAPAVQSAYAAAIFQLPPSLCSVEIKAEDGRSFGLIIASENRGPYEERILATREYSEIARLLIAVLKGHGVLIDLGANVGTVTLPVAMTGSRVLAVEMLPENSLRLRLAALVNRFPHVRIVQAAASDADGLTNYLGGEAFARVSADGSQMALSLTLDTIVAGIDLAEPGFLAGELAIKLDIEGHEYRALQGAERLLARRPIVVFEAIEMEGNCGDATRCKLMLQDMNYRLFMLRDRILVPKAASDLQEELVADFLALPAERTFEIGYEIRQPSHAEQMRWLAQTAAASPDHRTHATRVLARLAAEDAAFARVSAELRQSL